VKSEISLDTGFKNFGTGVESEFEKVTLATDIVYQRWYRIRSGLRQDSAFFFRTQSQNFVKTGVAVTFQFRQEHGSVWSFPN